MTEGNNTMGSNRSMLRDFVASISTMSGDLSNITAPPFVLDTKSTVELPSFWAENPSIFCAPAHADDPAERALLVLKWYLSSLRNQNYMGHSEDHGVKKPLNAFLGELFLAKWEDGMGTTKLVSEQVSHHPPITACRVWNDEHGVSASGYTRQTITFSGSVSIKQTGHALFHLAKRDETYLIPLPELKVRGVLTGTPYPELSGQYYITSTSGYMCVLHFSGKGWFSGNKHAFEASVFKESEGEDHPLYILKGTWNESFTIYDVAQDEVVETFDVMGHSRKTTKLIVDPIEEQDPWETRRAWAGVISSLHSGDMKGVVAAKSKVEQGQRQMRRDEERSGTSWEHVFFTSTTHDDVAEALMEKIPGSHHNLEQERRDTKGVWTFDQMKYEKSLTKPFKGDMVPDNSHRGESTSVRNSIDMTSSGRNGMSSPRNSINDNSRPSRLSLESQPSSTPGSQRNSIDAGRTSLDSTDWRNNHSNNGTSKHQKRSSIGSRLAFWTPFRKSESTMSDAESTRSDSSLTSHAASNAESGTHSPLPPTKSIEHTIHKETPGPQVEQAMQSEEAKLGSGIKGMSLEEKIQTENVLRDVYSSR